MTTLLPTQDLAMLRAVARTASVLLVVLRIEQIYPGRATSDEEIADILEADPRTVKKQLRSLSAAGLVLEQRDGRYVVTVAGRNTLFGFAQQQNSQTTSFSIEESKISDRTPELCAQNVLLDKKKEEEDSKLSKESSSSNLKSRQSLRIGNEITFAIENGLKVVPIVTGYTFANGEPVYKMDCVDGSFLTTSEIVSAAQMLEGFENGIVTNGLSLDAIKPEVALAWIAQAYDQRKKLNNPASLVYRRLEDISQPHANLKYVRNPKKYLPEEYLVDLRLEVKAEHAVIDIPCDAEPEQEVEPRELDETLVNLWKIALASMQEEIPPAQFDTWLCDTQPIGEQEGVLIVGARNSYCRDWLESRMTVIAKKYVKRDVRFVVSAEAVAI